MKTARQPGLKVCGFLACLAAYLVGVVQAQTPQAQTPQVQTAPEAARIGEAVSNACVPAPAEKIAVSKIALQRRTVPIFSVTVGRPRWEYVAGGAGSGSQAFAPPHYAIIAPLQIGARVALPEGKTVRDYLPSGIRLLTSAPPGGAMGLSTDGTRVFLTNVSPRGGKFEGEITLKRPDQAPDNRTRRENFEFKSVPVEIAGDAASQLRHVAEDGSVTELRTVKRSEGRYHVVFHVQTPPAPRDALPSLELSVTDDSGKVSAAGSVTHTPAGETDFDFSFPTAPASAVRTVDMALRFSRYAPSWETPNPFERHVIRLVVAPLPEKNRVDGSDLVRGEQPQTYRGPGGARSITVKTWIPEENDLRGAATWRVWPTSFLHDPKLNPSTPWRIREIVLRDAGNRALYRDGWPHFWPQEYNAKGLPLRREFYGQNWEFRAPKTARNTRTLEVRWTPVVERNLAARFGPFDLSRAARAPRLNTRQTLHNGVLSLRTWQLRPRGASKNQTNERYPLALWFSYASKNRGASFSPTRVEWEDEVGRRPEESVPWIEGWNLKQRRPRRLGEADANAWRARNRAPAANAKRLFLVIYGIERRIAGPVFSRRTPLQFSP